MRSVVDYHVDRPEVQARISKGAQLTGTNRSIGLIVVLFVPRFLRCQLRRRNPSKEVCSTALPTILFPGDHTGRVTPVPIPNTAVKPARADDSLTAKVGRCLDFLPPHPALNKRGVRLLTDRRQNRATNNR